MFGEMARIPAVDGSGVQTVGDRGFWWVVLQRGHTQTRGTVNAAWPRAFMEHWYSRVETLLLATCAFAKGRPPTLPTGRSIDDCMLDLVVILVSRV